MRILIPRTTRSLLRPLTRQPLRWATTATRPSTVEHTTLPTTDDGAGAVHSNGAGPLVKRLQGVYDVLEGDVGGEEVWSERVRSAVADLQRDRKLRMGVYSDTPPGLPSAAGTVVTSLLLDPFSEDEPTTRAIQARHAEVHAGGEYVIRYAQGMKRDIDALGVESPWLRDAQVYIVEVTSTSPQSALSTLLSTDVTLLVLDPIRLLTPTLQTLIRELEGKPNVQLIIDGALPGHSSSPTLARQTVLNRLQNQWAGIYRYEPRPKVPHVVWMDSECGIDAIHALQRTITPAPATASTATTTTGNVDSFSDFQKGYLASNLGDVSQALLGTLRTLHAVWGATRLQTAEHTLRRSEAYIHRTLGRLSDDARRVFIEADELRALAAHEASEIVRASAASGAVIREELKGAREGVEGVLKAWNGWRFAWGVERVGEGVGRVVDERWGHALGYQLAYECGRLEQIHHRISTKTDKLLKTHAPIQGATAPFYSPLLMNQLSQLELDARISPTTLLNPIVARRDQLLTAAVPTLQQRALNACITAWSTTFLSASASWTACVPLELVSSPTATGLGLLGAVGSLRWAVGRWAKTQRRFWADWERVERGLEDDMTRELGGVVERRVVRKAVVAAEGLEALARRRMERVDDVEERLKRVTCGES